MGRHGGVSSSVEGCSGGCRRRLLGVVLCDALRRGGAPVVEVVWLVMGRHDVLDEGDDECRFDCCVSPDENGTIREKLLKEALADVEELDFLEDTLERGRVAIPNDGISIECDGCVAIGLGGRRVRLSCG